MRIVMWMAAAVAIAASGCKKEGGGNPEMFDPISGASGSGVASAMKAAGAPDAGVRGSAAEVTPAGPADIHVGMTREQFVEAAGDCAVRIVFVPATGNGSRYVEVFQPRPGPCVKRLEERRFTIVGGKLETIEPGLDTVAAAAADRQY
jgi:hypothetical protein